jgi:hypothetical protein
MQSTERWKSIPGYEGYYEVSDHGRIRTVERFVRTRGGGKRIAPARIRKVSVNSTGRAQVGLSRDGHWMNMKVHRAVALAFLGPEPAGMEVCHGDGNPLNNHVSNLRWGTKKTNSADTVRMRRFPAQSRTSCPRGHALIEPNITAVARRKGWRACLACSRARAQARLRGVPMESLIDDYYAQIMGEEYEHLPEREDP